MPIIFPADIANSRPKLGRLVRDQAAKSAGYNRQHFGRTTLALCTLALPSLADNVSAITVSAVVGDGGLYSAAPGCGGTVTGTTSAQLSYACDFTSTSHSGIQTTG